MDFRKRAFNYFTSLGYKPWQAAALAGHSDWESAGGKPTIYGDAGKSFGLFQWDKNRKAGLYEFAKSKGLDPEGEETQLAYAHHELTAGGERAAGKMLSASENLQQANDAVLAYLRPQGYDPKAPGNSHAYTQRYNRAAPLINAPAIEVPPMPPTVAVAPAPQVADVAAAEPVAEAESVAAGVAKAAGKDWGALAAKLGQQGASAGAHFLAGGQPVAAPAAPQIAPGFFHRPDMQAGGLLNPFVDPRKRRLGLLA